MTSIPAAWSALTIALNSRDRVARRRSSAVGGEEAEGVVAPVVHQALLQQVAVVEVVVDRQQLDGRDAELGRGARSTASQASPA